MGLRAKSPLVEQMNALSIILSYVGANYIMEIVGEVMSAIKYTLFFVKIQRIERNVEI